jgi:tetratricopeptide (TPR) repeat protein
LGERLMFVPSFGFLIALVLGLQFLMGSKRNDPKSFSQVASRGLLLILFAYSGLTMARVGDWKNNFLLFEKGVERSPNSSRAHYSLATEYLRMSKEEPDPISAKEDLRKAAEHFEKSLEIFPDNFQAHYNAAICFGNMGDTSRCIDHYRKSIHLNPKYITSVNNLGVVYQAKKIFDSAQYYYEMAFQLDPEAPLSVKNLGDLFAMKGLYQLESGDRSGAMKSYKKSLEINANNPMLVNNIASMYSSENKQDSALVYLKRGLDLDPNSMRLIENYAAVSFLNKQYEQAIEYAQKAMKIQPNSIKSLGVLADTYRAMGNLSEAQKYQNLYNQFRK